MPSTTLKTPGTRLKHFRTVILDLTQSQMSAIFDMDQSQYAKMEADKNIHVPIAMAQTLARKYNLNIHWWLTGRGEMLDNN